MTTIYDVWPRDKPEITVTPELACQILIDRTNGECENNTSGIGSCFKQHREILALYGASQVCTTCLAWIALNGNQRS